MPTYRVARVQLERIDSAISACADGLVGVARDMRAARLPLFDVCITCYLLDRLLLRLLYSLIMEQHCSHRSLLPLFQGVI
jgi:hypothetical protein